jgi:uncharacterized Tic20 family protein
LSDPVAATRDARKWATICHLSALVGLLGNGIGFLLGPLIVWLLKREDDPFIDAQGKEAVNFQLTMFLAMLVAGVLALLLVGFLLMAAVGLVMIALPIVAAVQANEGRPFRYPFAIRFIS